jgi:uncharacterized DUF497 family protein
MSVIVEWDLNKARQNIKKHGVSFDEAATVFTDPLSLTIDDPLHSDTEERLIIVGESARRRLLVVVHIDAGERIRIISARVATTHERKDYEEGQTNI